MDAKILALIKTNQSRRLMPEEIATVNAYVIAGKTPDLISLGTEVSNNAIGYHKSKTKLSDHGEYFAVVKAAFNRLSKDGRVDGCAKWTRWLEATFHAYDKNQKDYFTKLANAHIKLLRNDPPKPKPNYKTLALDLTRMVLCGDRDGAEKLALQIAQENGDKIEKAKNSAFSSQTTTSVKATPKPKKTHVFGSQNFDDDEQANTITGLCGRMILDSALALPRDSDPKLVTCSVCKLLLKKQQKRMKENGSKMDTTGPVVHTLLSCGDGKYYAACDPQTAVPFHTRKATCTECLKIKAATPPKAKTHARGSYNSKTRSLTA